MQPRKVVHPLVLLTLAASLVPGAVDASRKTGNELPAVRVAPVATATIDFRHLAEAAPAAPSGLATPFVIASPYSVVEPDVDESDRSREIPTALPMTTTVATPSPNVSFTGGDDVAKIGTSTFVIPPGADGAVGPTKIFSTLNNNFRVVDKVGAVLSTLSIDTFWAATGGSGFYDTRVLYDPATDRFFAAAVSNAATPSSSVLVGVSQTGDPSGSWFLARFDADVPNTSWADFPLIGLSSSFFAVNVTMVPTSGGASTGRMWVLDSGAFRTGTAAATIFDGTAVCSAPAMTYGASTTLYVPTHLVSSNGTFRIDRITGPGSAPVYTVGTQKARGVVWTQPAGVVIPQALPLSGASACGSPACRVETPDAQIRSTPVVRGGSLFYAQTIGLPAGGMTHTGILWTKLDAASGTVQDGGVLEDPAATSSLGAWYAHPSIAVNASGDVLLGFDRFAGDSFPTAAYAVHTRADAPGVLNTPAVLRSGQDYYHRELLGGRNRWGDYSKAQVDPANDNDLWVLAEYAAQRASTDDTSGTSNGSRWGTYWGMVAPSVPAETAPGASGISSALRWTNETTLTWAANGAATSGYRVYRGTATDLPALLTSATDSCLRGTSATTTLASLSETPPGNGFYWYLVTGASFWGDGSFGNATSGARIVNSAGSCP